MHISFCHIWHYVILYSYGEWRLTMLDGHWWCCWFAKYHSITCVNGQAYVKCWDFPGVILPFEVYSLSLMISWLVTYFCVYYYLSVKILLPASAYNVVELHCKHFQLASEMIKGPLLCELFLVAMSHLHDLKMKNLEKRINRVFRTGHSVL